MKILCTNSYFYYYDKKQWETAQPYPPLGTLFAIAVLEKAGFDIRFHDNNLVRHHSEIYPKIGDESPQVLVLYDDGFNYLTKMCLTNMREAVYEILAFAKKQGIITICSSSDSTDHYQNYHKEGADYVIHGEGEASLLELCEAIRDGEGVTEIKGISYKKDDSIILNPQRPVLRTLDELPMAAWDRVDIDPYREIWMKKYGYFSLNIATTRGCPYKCNWCAKPIYGNRYNSRSPEKVMDEIDYLIKRFDVQYFWMCDDIFGLKPNWVQRFRDEKQKRGLDFRYKIQSRVDLMLKDDNLDALVASGVDIVWVGAESGSQKILDAMDKGTKVEQIYEATHKLKAHGARIAFFLQFGYLGETWSDIQQTIRMVLDLMPDEIGISVSYPLPGTKFYDKVKSELGSKANWTDSDDLDLMFQNTYPPVFYKTLHRYVHNRYRIRKGWLTLSGRVKSSARELGKNLLRMAYHLPQAVYHRFLLKRFATLQS